MTPADWTAVRLTAQLAALTTLLLLLAGTPVAWWLARTRSAAQAVQWDRPDVAPDSGAGSACAFRPMP